MITRQPARVLFEDAEGTSEMIWVNVENPKPEECQALSAEFDIPKSFFTAALDINEHPRVEHEKNCALLLLRAPTNEPENIRAPFGTAPVSILCVGKTIITMCPKENIVEGLLQQTIHSAANTAGAQTRHQIPLMRHAIHGTANTMQNAIVLALAFRIGTEFIRIIQQMITATETIEQTLQKSMQNKELLSLLHMEKSLIFFLTSLKGNCTVIEEMMQNNPLQFSSTELARLRACFTEMRQATDMGDVFSQILGSVGDTFGAIVSNNLNKVMKILTALTIVLMIPTLVAGVYGMNVPLPWQERPSVFFWLSTSTLLFSVATGYFFWRKDWM